MIMLVDVLTVKTWQNLLTKNNYMYQKTWRQLQKTFYPEPETEVYSLKVIALILFIVAFAAAIFYPNGI